MGFRVTFFIFSAVHAFILRSFASLSTYLFSGYILYGIKCWMGLEPVCDSLHISSVPYRRSSLSRVHGMEIKWEVMIGW